MKYIYGTFLAFFFELIMNFCLAYDLFLESKSHSKTSTHQDKWRGFLLITLFTTQVTTVFVFGAVAREMEEKERVGNKCFHSIIKNGKAQRCLSSQHFSLIDNILAFKTNIQ